MNTQKKLLLGLILICFMLTLGAKTAFAEENVNISFEPTETSTNVGGNVSVAINVEADTDISEVDMGISYNADVLEYVSGTECIKGDAGYLRLSDKDSSSGKSRQYVMNFTAKDVGNSSFGIASQPSILDAEYNELEYAFVTKTVTINGSTESSTDATLKEIKVSPSSLEESFSADVVAYNVIIPYNCDFIAVSATATDEKAKVEVEGGDELKNGWNKVIILVTAPAGNTKKYTLSVYRQYEDESNENKDKTNQDKNNTNTNKNGELVIKQEDGKTILSNTFEYEVVQLDDPSKIPSGFKETKVSLFGNQIVAYVLEDDPENDFILIYASNTTTGDSNFYQYDKVENTLQRFSGNLVSSVKKASTVTMTQDEYQKKITICGIVIALLAVLLALTVILLIKQLLKSQNLQDDDMFD